MHVFWLRGYEGVGLSQLQQEMGISRQSLYDTFGSKRGLFVRAIEHYRETQLAEALKLLEREGSRLENVKQLVKFFEGLALDQECHGCLVANTLVELGPHDEEIAEMLRETLGLLQEAILKALCEAQQRGELAPSKSPPELARALVNAMIGLAVTGRLRSEPEDLRAIYAGTLSMLD